MRDCRSSRRHPHLIEEASDGRLRGAQRLALAHVGEALPAENVGGSPPRPLAAPRALLDDVLNVVSASDNAPAIMAGKNASVFVHGLGGGSFRFAETHTFLTTARQFGGSRP
ncbi:MAG: hypothetical protein AAFS03_09035 [Pseudomonadota bacterium]